jgi:hypothetical protein
MNGQTPYEKLCSFNSILLPHRFLSFPILILDECLGDIIYHTKTIDLMIALESLPTFQDHKSLVDFKDSLSIVNNKYAQNVLNHYLFIFFLPFFHSIFLQTISFFFENMYATLICYQKVASIHQHNKSHNQDNTSRNIEVSYFLQEITKLWKAENTMDKRYYQRQ